MTEDKALDLALEALEFFKGLALSIKEIERAEEAIAAIKQARSAKQERHFCERCGKRLGDYIHTCTPPAAPMQDSTCNETLRAQGKAYPRTCRKCGKGPCIALVNAALDKKAENARELGLDYEPDEWLTGCPECGMDSGCDCDSGTWNPPAAPVQKPVWIRPDELQKAQKAPFLCRVEPNKRDDFVPLYTTPPAAQRQWVGLTDAEVMQTMSGDWTSQFYFARAIEAKLKEKNT